jgi:CheY-like chemotaxis protein
MPSGGKLTIAAKEVSVGEPNSVDLKAGSYLRIMVADTGTGMDQATVSRAVEPFFSTKGVGKGTGLGLSMVHGLAAQSGGTLQLSSEPGKGTAVELWLPATQEKGARAAQNDAEPVRARQSTTVLLVDDEDLVRTATAEMLRDLGYTVVEAASGAQALSSLRSGVEAKVLVTDYLMPGMSGAALVHEMREAGHQLPSLIITAYANAGLDVPADVPRLAKPFRQVDLATRLDELLEREPSIGMRGHLRAVD